MAGRSLCITVSRLEIRNNPLVQNTPTIDSSIDETGSTQDHIFHNLELLGDRGDSGSNPIRAVHSYAGLTLLLRVHSCHGSQNFKSRKPRPVEDVESQEKKTYRMAE
uniref:Uncharacterized protein n=1 Tax=Anopheles culicifacies TaxID=139723 RepID=A0A182M892_9DIPT